MESLATLVGNTSLLKLFLRGADTCSLRSRKNGGRHDIETNSVLLVKDMIHSMNSLHLCCMSQHLPAIHIANSIDTLHRSLEIIINLNTSPFVKLNTCIGKVCLHSRFSPRSHQDNISIDISDILYSRLHLKSNALFLQRLTQTFGDVAVKRRQALFEELYHRNLRTKAIEDRGELHTNDTSADNCQTLGLGFKVQQSRGIHHTRVVKSLDWKPLCLGSRCYYDILGGDSIATNGTDNGMVVNE